MNQQPDPTSEETATQQRSTTRVDDVDPPDLSTELDDIAAQPRASLADLDAKVLANPIVIRALGGIAIATIILLWPDRTDRIFARLVGIALLLFAAANLIGLARRQLRGWRPVASIAVTVPLGIYVFSQPNDNAERLGRVIGALILAWVAASVLDARTRPNRRKLAMGWVAATICGLLLLIYPNDVLSVMTVAFAVGWIALSAIVLTAVIGGNDLESDDNRTMREVALDWLRDRYKSSDAREALYDKILFDGPNQRRRLVRFYTLMTFAAIIASMGVITDSTAVVIGAMLIAPLMTPLMGMAISLVMGWPNRLALSATVAITGILLAIGIGILMGLISPTVINTETNSQILARSTPTLLDLMTALAAGAAGAYGLSRPDVSDSLPGVAIAISLVPPLSVVGISYSQGDWTAGNGSLLLFLTNMVAILLMGGITFILTGVTPLSVAYEGQRRMRTAFASVAALGAMVLGGLLLNGSRIATNEFNTSRANDSVEDWLGDTPDYTLVNTEIDGDVVTATVVGPSNGLGNVDDLAESLSESFDKPITVNIRLVVQEQISSADDTDDS